MPCSFTSNRGMPTDNNKGNHLNGKVGNFSLLGPHVGIFAYSLSHFLGRRKMETKEFCKSDRGRIHTPCIFIERAQWGYLWFPRLGMGHGGSVASGFILHRKRDQLQACSFSQFSESVLPPSMVACVSFMLFFMGCIRRFMRGVMSTLDRLTTIKRVVSLNSGG